MKKIVIYSLLLISLLCISWGFHSFGTGKGFKEYLIESDYRRLHPDLLPPPILIRVFDMGHSTSYASFMWLELIQYIADNLGGNKYLDFTHTILEQITELHPYFSRPYELDLILTPFSRGENQTPEQKAKNKVITKKAIELGKIGIDRFCDQTKVAEIRRLPIGESLWNNSELKNPCTNGLLPYYLGFTIYQMGDNKTQASEYYKIASMNDDAPIASRKLSLIALSAEGDFLDSAMSFSLIANTGYDIEPYTCNTLASHIIKDIEEKRTLSHVWINELEKEESSLTDTRDPKNPVSQSSNNCYDMIGHSIKAIYLQYITNIAKGATAKNGDDLIKLGLLDSIPTISSQKGFTVRKIDDLWEFGQKLN